MHGRNGKIKISEKQFLNTSLYYQYFVLLFVLMVLGIAGSVVGMSQVRRVAPVL